MKYQTYDVVKHEDYLYKFKRVMNYIDKHLGYVISIVLAMKLLNFPDFFIITGFIFIMYIMTRRLIVDARIARKQRK